MRERRSPLVRGALVHLTTYLQPCFMAQSVSQCSCVPFLLAVYCPSTIAASSHTFLSAKKKRKYCGNACENVWQVEREADRYAYPQLYTSSSLPENNAERKVQDGGANRVAVYPNQQACLACTHIRCHLNQIKLRFMMPYYLGLRICKQISGKWWTRR